MENGQRLLWTSGKIGPGQRIVPDSHAEQADSELTRDFLNSKFEDPASTAMAPSAGPFQGHFGVAGVLNKLSDHGEGQNEGSGVRR